MKKRRRFTPEVGLDVLTGLQSPAEASRRHAPSANLSSTWKATFPQRAHAAFQAVDECPDEQARIAELERLVGRPTIEHEVLKKASTPLAGRSDGGGRRP